MHDREILQLVEEDNGHTKSSREWYYALFDYGTHLGKQVKNPNRQSKHYTKQKVFEGSHRQIQRRGSQKNIGEGEV